MAFYQKSSARVPLTPELASSIADMPAYGGDRSFSTTRAKWHIQALKDGTFRPPTFSIAEVQGRRFRVDGNHRATVLATANGHFPQGMTATIDVYACEDMADVARLWGTFDAAFTVRTQGDVNAAFAYADEGLRQLNLPSRATNAISSGLAFWHEWNSREKLRGVDKAKLLHQHRDFVMWCGGLIQGASDTNGKLLTKASVTAAMYETHRAAPLAAQQFWIAVREGTEANPKNPSRLLRDWLLQNAMHGGAGGVMQRQAYALAVNAWNLWRKGATRTVLRWYKEGPLPKAE